MIRFRKIISLLLVLTLICSMLPSYVGAAENEQNEEDNKSEVVKTENLKEIVKERTADTKTFSNGDGNFVKEVYPEEIHNKVGKNYSEDLVKKNKTGYLETEATNLQAEFPEDMKENSPIVYSSDGHQLSFNLSYATDGDNKTNPSSSAVTGAIGIGIVGKLSEAAKLGTVAQKFLAGHIAPAAYLVGNFGDLSKGGFTENQIVSAFSTKSNLIWAGIKPFINKIYNKYKGKKKAKKTRKKWWF